MIVMPSNATGFWVGYLAHKYERATTTLWHLFSPGGELARGPVMQYALDNGAFGCGVHGKRFDVPAWRTLLRWADHAVPPPMWCLVPDVVGDRDGTLRLWDRFAPILKRNFGWPLAFAAQDGMTFADVPTEAAVVFIGGSDEFKAASLFPWCARFRCHVGRVNALDHMRLCLRAGAESCDGTGHFMTDRQRKEVALFLAEANGERPAPTALPSWLSAERVAPTVRRSRSTSTGARALTGAVK